MNWINGIEFLSQALSFSTNCECHHIFVSIPHNLLGETHTDENLGEQCPQPGISHPIEYSTEQNSFPQIPFGYRVRSRDNLFAKTLSSPLPLGQNYAGNMRPGARHLPAFIADTSCYTGRNACFTSPLSRARPFKRI